MTISEIATALAWLDALNDKDFDTLVSLSSDDVEIGDVDGAAQGHAGLLEWVRAHPLTVVPGRMFVHDGVVVAEHQPPSADGTQQASASAFRVVHDHVTSVFWHADLASALAATELTEDDLAG